MHQKDFDYGLVNLLSEFLERLPAPICLVAHNGLRFDFPLLQAELVSIGRHGALPSDLLCLDTLVMFRSFEESLKHAQNSNQDSKSKASQPDHPALEQPVNVPLKKASSSQKQRTDWWGLSDDETDSSTPAKPKVETKSTIPLAPAFEDCVKKSFKLGDIHHRVTGKYPEETHRAEDDALTLIR